MTTDLTPAIAPKSDQLNADDLISGPKIITITRVSVIKGEQPITINFEDDNGKPYKPCKSMGRVLVLMWGADGKAFTGRRLQLVRDPDVTFGPDKVGGIRISHMSDIDGERTVALTTTRGRRKPYTVKPLRGGAGAARQVHNLEVGGASPPPAPKHRDAGDDFPGDRTRTITFRGVDYDPVRPCAFDLDLDLSVDDFTDDQCKAFARAIRDLIRAAPDGARARGWYDRNTPELLRLKARFPSMVAQIEEALRGRETSSPASKGDEDRASGRPGGEPDAQPDRVSA